MFKAPTQVARCSCGHRLAVAFLFTLALAGCAVQPAANGGLSFQLDQAELLGETVQTFRLADGGEGRLRRLSGEYSIKLQQYFRVIPLGVATSLRVQRVENLGQQTVLVMEKSTPDCPRQTLVYAIEGKDVSGWEIGNCRDLPRILTGNNQVGFEFASGGSVQRYTYKEGAMLKGDPRLTGGVAGQGRTVITDGARRYVPPAPMALTSKSESETPTTQAARTSPRAPRPSNKTAPVALPSAKDLGLSGDKVQPTIKLVLDEPAR